MHHLLFVSTLSLLFFSACQTAEVPKNADTDASASTTAITIDTFSHIPSTLSGCGNIVFSSDFDLEQQRFLFVAGRDTATIHLDGQQWTLDLHEDNSDGATVRRTFVGNGYKVSLDLRQMTKTAPRLGLYEGDLVIERPGASLRKTVKALVGC